MDKDLQSYLVNKIKSEYTEKTSTEFDALVSLDRKIKLPPLIQAYTCGVVGTLILGFGMSLIMTDIGAIFGINSSFTWNHSRDTRAGDLRHQLSHIQKVLGHEKEKILTRDPETG